ncbi:MAG: ABC transporter permease subunit [Desulfobacterales bacterium]|nr:MAG: ABC transporter permease subunit [Desulfobacterales bacterium]
MSQRKMLWRFEIIKLIRSWRPAVAGAALALFLTLMLFGFYTYAAKETGGQVQFRYTFENRSYFNGLTFALYAFYFAVLMVLPIFAAAEGGSQLASETAAKTIHLLLARPLSRSRIFAAKLILAAIYTLILVGVFLAGALIVGLFAVGWGELRIYPGVLQMTDSPQYLTQNQALRAFLLAWPAASIALMPPLAMSFLLSVWIRSPINAVAAAVAVYLVLYVISQVHFFFTLQPYLFTTYIGYWRLLFREEVPWQDLMRDGAKLVAFTFGFLTLAYHRFRVREET